MNERGRGRESVVNGISFVPLHSLFYKARARKGRGKNACCERGKETGENVEIKYRKVELGREWDRNVNG